MTGSAGPTTIRFVATEGDVPPAEPGTVVVVLDPAFSPWRPERDDVLSARDLHGAVAERIDLFDDALERVDRWADETRIADALLVEGVTYWFRLRETSWRWIHERLLWRHLLGDLDPGRRLERIEVPAGRTALIEVAGAWRPGTVEVVGGAGPDEPDASAGVTLAAARPRAVEPVPVRAMRRALASLARVRGGSGGDRSATSAAEADQARRTKLLDERVARLVAGHRPRVLVLTNPRTYQRIGDAHGIQADPLFGSLLERLPAAGFDAIRFGSYVDHRRPEGWAIVADDAQLLPQSMLQGRWMVTDEARPTAALDALGPLLDSLARTSLDLDGVELGPAFGDMLATTIRTLIRSDLRITLRVERLLAELRPAVIVLAQEGIRTAWLAAAGRAGIPVVAVQHGVLYEGHPGYPHQRHAAHLRPTMTCVYGDWERDVLVRRGAYLDEEVAVTGSPRLDLDVPATPADRAAERAALRAELGVGDDERLLVLSTVNLPFVQASHFSHGLARTLNVPLPGVHLVFKLHPGEFDDGPYRALIEGLARAGGYPAPPVTVLKDVDLYRLLRAGDAHLGMLSTVLTDAVGAGTPNLIVTIDRHSDLLGYVEAQVAVPVQDGEDVRAALASDLSLSPQARDAFLARHFRSGDATARILELVTNASAAGATDGRPDHGGR